MILYQRSFAYAQDDIRTKLLSFTIVFNLGCRSSAAAKTFPHLTAATEGSNYAKSSRAVTHREIDSGGTPPTFEKVDETFAVGVFGGFNLQQYSVCSPRSKTPAAGKFFPTFDSSDRREQLREIVPAVTLSVKL